LSVVYCAVILLDCAATEESLAKPFTIKSALLREEIGRTRVFVCDSTSGFPPRLGGSPKTTSTVGAPDTSGACAFLCGRVLPSFPGRRQVAPGRCEWGLPTFHRASRAIVLSPLGTEAPIYTEADFVRVHDHRSREELGETVEFRALRSVVKRH